MSGQCLYLLLKALFKRLEVALHHRVPFKVAIVIIDP